MSRPRFAISDGGVRKINGRLADYIKKDRIKPSDMATVPRRREELEIYQRLL